MSAGAFIFSRYALTDDPTRIVSIRVQPETLVLTLNAVANASPAGAVNSSPSAVVSRGRRSAGINARLVSVRFTGTPPTGYLAGSTIRLPWLNSATFGAVTRGQTGTYLGGTVVCTGKVNETVR